MEYSFSADWAGQPDAGSLLSTIESLTIDLKRGGLIYSQMFNENLKTTQARLSLISAEIIKGTNCNDDKVHIEKALRWRAVNMPGEQRPGGPFGI